jgi:hypothetical protein
MVSLKDAVFLKMDKFSKLHVGFRLGATGLLENIFLHERKISLAKNHIFLRTKRNLCKSFAKIENFRYFRNIFYEQTFRINTNHACTRDSRISRLDFL